MRKAIITTAGNMSKETFDYICSIVEKKFNEKFEFVRKEDSMLIGGFTLNIEDEIFDLSVKTQLDKFKEHVIK